MSERHSVTELDQASVKADLASVKTDLARARGPLAAMSAVDIARLLGRVGSRFADPADPVRETALRELPAEAALSPELAEAVLDGMAADWTEERIAQLLRAEFPDPGVLDGIVERPLAGGGEEAALSEDGRGRAVMAFGPTLCVQISSGGVPGVGVHALIRSLLVKSPTLIKPGAGDVLLTRLFADALAEADPVLGAAVAARYWPGEERELTAAAVAGADLVVAYGSDASVQTVRDLIPVTTRFVPYHHRFGVGLVGREALGPGVEDVARDVARAVAMFEHRGCVCPHVVFVEEHGPMVPEAFAERVGAALEAIAREWPAAAESDDAQAEAAALAQARGTVEIHEAAGAARMMDGGVDNWTVVFETDLVEIPALPGRAVRIRSVGDLAEVPAILGSAGRHLQSVGYAGVDGRIDALAQALGQAGASRVVPFAHVSFPPPWWLHDGQGPLTTLVRWVEVG